MSQAVVELLAKDLNGQGGVFCPNPKAQMQLCLPSLMVREGRMRLHDGIIASGFFIGNTLNCVYASCR